MSKGKISDGKSVRSRRRDYITRTINKAMDIIRNFEETDRFRLEGIRGSLKEKSDVLKELDAKFLATLDEDAVGNKINSSSDFSLQILEIIFEIDSVLREVSKGEKPSSEGNHNENFSSLTTNLKTSVKLPNLNMNYFSRNPLDFQSFLDSFNAAIHENDNIPPMTKFNYLKSFSEGPGAGCMSGLNLTADNYQQALDTLAQRYGNKQLLISTHMDQLLSIKPILNLHDAQKLRETFDKIELNVRNLKRLNADPQQYGSV